MKYWIIGCGLLFTLSGCTSSAMLDMAKSLNERQISHCLYLHGAVPPYGYGTLLAKSGEMDCIEIWREWSKPPL